MPINATFTADTRPLARGLNDAAREIGKVTKATGDAARSLKGVGSQFDGTRIEGQALRVAEAVRRVGGAAKLTDSELARVSRTVQEATQKFERMGQTAPPHIQRLSKELQQVQKSAGGVSQALSSFTSGLGIGVGAGAGFAALTAIGAGLRDIVAEGAKLGPIRQGFEHMQGGAAQAEVTLQRMRAATLGLADDLTLMTAANRGVLLGLTDMGIDMAEVASVATRLGRAVGQDAAKSTDDLTVALARQSPMILDNLGIKLNLTEANERYAATLGKSVDALTDEEKKLAFATAAMEAARQKAAELGEAQLTVAEETQAATVALRGIIAEFAEAANQSRVLTVPLARLAEVLQTIRGAGIGSALRFGVSSAVEDAQQVLDRIPGARLTPLGMLATTTLNQARSYFGASGSDVQRVIGAVGGIDSASSIGTQIAREATERAKNATAIRAETRAGRDRTAQLHREAEALARVERSWQAMRRGPQIGVVSSDLFSSTGISGALRGNLYGDIGALTASSFLPSSTPLSSAMMPGVYNAIRSDMPRATAETRNWRIELQGVAQAVANMAQVAGPAMDKVTRGLGAVLTSANAGAELAKALGMTDAKGNLTRGGRAIGGGVAGLSTGLAIGGLMTNPTGAFFAGAAGGAASGAMVGGPLGAGVGAFIGGFSSLFAAGQNRKAQMQQLDALRQQTIAQYGTLERLQEEAERAGYSVERFMQLFTSSNPVTFAETMTTLTARLNEQKQAADALSESLASVTGAQGVISQQQLAQIRTADVRGPGADALAQFAEAQRQQALTGASRAAGALQVILDRAEGNAGAVMARFESAANATAAALFTAFSEAVAAGASAVDVMRQLGPGIETLRTLFAGAGRTPGAGFQSLSLQQRIATGEDTSPAVELASGLGQALGAFANTGLLSPELFNELANGIGAAYKEMENLGLGGLEAARVLQPALQNIWQLVQDYPGLEDQLDDDTRALLDFASQSGLIGDRFRPAVDRMIDALDRLIGRLDDFLARMAQAQGATLPDVPTGSGGTPDTDGSNGGSGGDYGGFATGSGGLRNFGRGTLAMLHGREAVLTEGQYVAMRAMAQAQLRPSSGGGFGGTIRVETPVYMDRRQVGLAVAEVQPSLYQTYTGVA